MSHLPKFNRSLILRTRSLDTLCISLTLLAKEFALLGELPIACELVSMINQHNPCFRCFYSIGYVKPLWIVWNACSAWPSGELENVDQSVDDLSEQYARELWSQAGIPEENRTYNEDGFRKLVGDLNERVGCCSL